MWVSMAQNEFPQGPIHAFMKRANELASANGAVASELPFAPVDVGFSELLDTIRAQKNQREIDLVFVTNLYHRAWKSLHISMGVLGEMLNQIHEKEVRDVYAALTRLELGHLMLDGLSKKCNHWLLKDPSRT